MKIKTLSLGSSIEFRKKQWVSLNSERDQCNISFDRGIFHVICRKTGEHVCFATTNVKQWVPEESEPEPSVNATDDMVEAEAKKRGRLAK